MSKFVPNRKLVSELAHSEGIAVVLTRLAERGAGLARATAPVGPTATFRDSIQATAGVDTDGLFKGRIFSDDPEAPHIEFGTSDSPVHSTLRNAAETVVGS